MFRDRDNYNAWMREYRRKRRAAETPEERAERRAKANAKYARLRAANPEKFRVAGLKARRKAAGVENPDAEVRAGACEICGSVYRKLNLDHVHATGKRRGWLCTTCNTGLGSFKDSPSLLRQAAAYLESKNVDQHILPE
jgi:hypothetical protein